MTGRVARLTATFSIFAPLIAILVGFLGHFVHPRIPGIRLVKTVVELLLIVSGLVCGAVALEAVQRRGYKGVFVKALIGTCVNGLLVLLTFGVSILFALWLPVFTHHVPLTPQGKLDKATSELATASTDEKRFYALDDAAKQSFETGKIEDAQKYATELLALAPNFQGNWNYGNAIQDGNLVLGRIAVREGRMEEAKKYLLEAGRARALRRWTVLART